MARNNEQVGEEAGRENAMPAWKRCLDLGLILVSAVVWVPLAALVALVIKVGSPGPVLFRQRRVGHRGSEFTCFKFRTMQVNAEVGSHRDHTRQLICSQTPMTKLDAKRDPRMIPLGRLLRATGLDELPQLINIVRGEMSLVGPRPCIPYEFELHQDWQRHRYDAFPGLTGLWQVNGKNHTTFNQMVEMDIAYAKTMSLWLDLKIITVTIPALWVQCMETRTPKRKESEPDAATAVKSLQSL